VTRFCLLCFAVLGPSHTEQVVKDVKLDAVDNAIDVCEISAISSDVEEVVCNTLPTYEDVISDDDSDYIPSVASEEGSSEPVEWTRKPKPLRLRRCHWELDDYDWFDNHPNSC
jgi:hypothetical protein